MSRSKTVDLLLEKLSDNHKIKFCLICDKILENAVEIDGHAFCSEEHADEYFDDDFQFGIGSDI